jgi:hypothetical protein
MRASCDSSTAARLFLAIACTARWSWPPAPRSACRNRGAEGGGDETLNADALDARRASMRKGRGAIRRARHRRPDVTGDRGPALSPVTIGTRPGAVEPFRSRPVVPSGRYRAPPTCRRRPCLTSCRRPWAASRDRARSGLRGYDVVLAGVGDDGALAFGGGLGLGDLVLGARRVDHLDDPDVAAMIGVVHCSTVHVSQWVESTTTITRSGLPAFILHAEEGLLAQIVRRPIA